MSRHLGDVISRRLDLQLIVGVPVVVVVPVGVVVVVVVGHLTRRDASLLPVAGESAVVAPPVSLRWAHDSSRWPPGQPQVA